MTVPEKSAETWCAILRRNLKSFILEPPEPQLKDRSSFHSVEEDNPEDLYEPATCTGWSELPTGNKFAILLLWSPRFFIPWVAAWQEYTLLFLANPEDISSHEVTFNQEMIQFSVKCSITMLVSFIAGIFDVERSAYLLLLILYTSCPIIGGYVDAVLHARLIDPDGFSHWFQSFALMRWANVLPFIFFPVQLTCIFYEREGMSKQAHYNWAGIFSLFEFLNAFIAFSLVPEGCPTTEWMHVAEWVTIGFVLYTVVLLTVILFLGARSLAAELVDCMDVCLHEKQELKGSSTSGPAVSACKLAACYLCIFAPVLHASFVFAVLQRFAPDEVWDKNESLPVINKFYMGRVIGVAVMILVLTVVRKYGKKVTRVRLLRSDVLALGVPHIVSTIALLVLYSRLATLSHPNEGDIVMGPVPDTTVLVFFNLIFRNRTVCVSSEAFRPAKIRPFHYATREVPSTLTNIHFTVTPEPESIPTVATSYEMDKVAKWNAFSITLVNYLAPVEDSEIKLKNYYTKPRVTRQNLNRTLPEKVPQVLILNTDRILFDDSANFTYLLKRDRLSQPTEPPLKFTANANGNAQLWKVSRTGNWSVGIQIDANESNLVQPWFDFNIDSSYSVYFLVNYPYAPMKPQQTYHQPVRFRLFKVSEAARSNSNILPSKQKIQADNIIQTGLTLAGMAAGGVYVGIIYMFWTEPFISTTWRFTILWELIAVAEEAPRVKVVDIDWVASPTLGSLQIVFMIVHFIGALFLYRSELERRNRPD